MGKTILVAGAGHGGLAAAADLARKGFSVTVIEQKEEADLGYDWTDIFAPKAFIAAGVPYPSRSLYSYKEDMAMYPPSQHLFLKQHVPENELEIKMERKDLYAHLIAHAKRCGVQFRFGTTVTAPLLLGSRVCGVCVGDEKIFADLVIDACGVDSPLRASLPDVCCVEKEPAYGEVGYAYRAFYNRAGDFEPENGYEVFLLHQGRQEIAWVATEPDLADVLIVRPEPFDMDAVETVLDEMRRRNPQIGDKLLRGGQFVKIPIRQPLAMLVADGYAALGDSAFMTVPMIGSGIANALKASHILSETVVADKMGAYTAETLWRYQTDYYKMLGSGLAALSVIRNAMFVLEPAELDFMFDRGILTEKEVTITADCTNISSLLKFSLRDVIDRMKKLSGDKILLTKILRIASQVASVTAICAMLPKTYNPAAVRKWVNSYTSFFAKLGKG